MKGKAMSIKMRTIITVAVVFFVTSAVMSYVTYQSQMQQVKESLKMILTFYRRRSKTRQMDSRGASQDFRKCRNC